MNSLQSRPWFRMYTEAVDDEKLRLLAFEDRWHFVALLCCKGKGILDEGNVSLMRRKVAVKLGLDQRELDEVARRLAEVDLIDSVTLQPLSWDTRQFESDSSTERVRAYRERRKRNGNVTVTPQETETDTDTDTEIAVSSVSSDEETTETTRQNSPQTASVLPRVPFTKIVDLYHATLPMLPRVEKLTDTRKGYIRQRWREDLPTLEHWENFFDFVSQSKFLTGRVPGANGKPPFRADIEWLCRPTNFTKIAEEKYHRG